MLPIADQKPIGGDDPLESALVALTTISSYLDSRDDSRELFGRLSATVATLTRARRAAFWRFGPGGTLTLQPAPYGFASGSAVHRLRVQMSGDGEAAISRLLSGQPLDLERGTSAALDALWRGAGLTEVESSMAAAWGAAGRRTGIVAVYDGDGGFTAHDQWLLRVSGVAAGLVWQHRESEDRLTDTAARLDQAMAACRYLLYNVAAGGDEARRRFAGALHDDSLQLLTAAELQLERLRADVDAGAREAHMETLGETLHGIEESLRGLLIHVGPEPRRAGSA